MGGSHSIMIPNDFYSPCNTRTTCIADWLIFPVSSALFKVIENDHLAEAIVVVSFQTLTHSHKSQRRNDF